MGVVLAFIFFWYCKAQTQPQLGKTGWPLQRTARGGGLNNAWVRVARRRLRRVFEAPWRRLRVFVTVFDGLTG